MGFPLVHGSISDHVERDLLRLGLRPNPIYRGIQRRIIMYIAPRAPAHLLLVLSSPRTAVPNDALISDTVTTKVQSKGQVPLHPRPTQPRLDLSLVHKVKLVHLQYAPPLIFHGPRSLDVDSSIIHQIDGLCWALFALRPERDIGARSSIESYTHLWGQAPHVSLSVDPGLYLAELSHCPTMVAAAEADRAVGIFVVPVRPGAAPCLTSASGASLGPWYDHLMTHAVFIFSIHSSSFVRRRHDGSWLPWIPPFGMVAVLANFGKSWIRKPKNRYRCQLRHFDLVPLTGVAAPTTRRLPVVPSLLHRPNPLHEEFRPDLAADTSPVCAPPPFEIPPGFQIPPSPLNPVAFGRETSDYPFPTVRRVALEAITGTLQPFVGDLEKSTSIPPERELRSEQHVLRARDCLMKNVKKELTAGPFALSPCPKARLCPVATVEKGSHDENPKESWAEDRARVATTVALVRRNQNTVSSPCSTRMVPPRSTTCVGPPCGFHAT